MIRKYKESEITELVNIWEEASTLAHPFLESEFTKKVKTAMNDIYLPNSDTWVFEKSGKITGFISMAGNEIGGLFVLPEHHSKGIGSQLVSHISKFHKELEVEVFEKNKIGRPFYKKLGFKLIHKYLHEESMQEVYRMKL